jgi:hypothetical protein
MAKRVNYFLPFMRQGLATFANHQAAGKRLRVPISLKLEAFDETGAKNTAVAEQEAVLFGPGDVAGINPRIITRIAPAPYTNNFEDVLTPFIEFAEPDFLWRYSTRQTADGKNWLPWLALIILKSGDNAGDSEFIQLKNTRPGLPPSIQLKPDATLPDLRESWRWAHVHLIAREGASREQLIQELKRAPRQAACRLMSPRRLKPHTSYQAFLVPAYRLGADTALGLPNRAEDRKTLTWETPAAGAGLVLPYYFQWAFHTGTQGDFEYLVRKLQPRKLEGLGTRIINCSNPGYGLQPTPTDMNMEAPLKSLDTQYQPWGMDESDGTMPNATRTAMAALLNKSATLRVTPPVYGEWYVGKANEAQKVNAQRLDWLEEINLDFRHRAAAGLGVQFVKENQEQLMKAAWEQLSIVQEANRILNLGRFGRAVSNSMHKRLDQMKADHLWKMSLPLQNKILADTPERKTTIGASLRASNVSNKLAQAKVNKYLPDRHSGSRVSAGPPNTAPNFFTPIASFQLVNQVFKINGTIAPAPGGSAPVPPPEPQPAEANMFHELGKKMKTALNPKLTIQPRLAGRFKRLREQEIRQQQPGPAGISSSDDSLDPLRPVLWHPEFHQPMYRYLRDLSQEFILSGLEQILPDTIGLLATNRRFIEAFMLGINHEFAAELRWREFPTDMQGSYFRSFWDTSIYSVDDAEKAQFWAAAAGQSLREVIAAQFGQAYSPAEIEAAYAKNSPSETEIAIGQAYEAAIEKWLLTRDEDKDIARIADWQPNTRLGTHPASGSNGQSQLVLLVRGELLQKFGNTLIYLARRKPGEPDKPDFSASAKHTFPVFEGALPPDIVFLGFPILADEAGEYFLVFEERITELRFGLDSTAEGDGIENLSWEHFAIAEGDYLDGEQPEILRDTWNSAAFIGKAMLQKQVRVAVELARMLPETESE